MKLGMIGDIHWGTRSNSAWFLEYQLAYFRDIAFPEFKKRGVTTLLCTGDFFHSRKNIEVFIYNKVKKEFLDLMREQGFEMIMIVGNHDLYYTENSEVTSLSILDEYENIQVITRPTELKFGSLKMGLIPWLSNQKEIDTFKTFCETGSCTTLFGHFEFNGYSVMPGVEHDGGLKESVVSGFDRVYSGHFHLKQARQNSNILYLGTPYEMDWGDHGSEKGVYVLDTETSELEFIKNKKYLHYKIEYDDTKIETLNKNLHKMKDKIVRLYVVNKTNDIQYSRYIYALEQIGPINYTVYDEAETDVEDFKDSLDEQNLYSVIEGFVTEKYPSPKIMLSILKKLYHDTSVHTTTEEGSSV